MASSINVLEESQTVEVIHEGSIDLAELIDVRRKASRFLQAAGYTRLYVNALNARFAGLVTEHNVFLLSHQEEFSPDVKIAAVVGEHNVLLEFDPEAVAKQGGTNMRVFTKEDDAREWLLADGA